jgi:DNA-binding Lrp family transcriptional regulator
MPLAFVLINAEIGSESGVHETLTQISHVTEAHVVYGVYDIVAKVEADTMARLKEVITYQIRRLDKVRSTLTMIVMDD